MPTAVARSRFAARVDQDHYLVCEDCSGACRFGAISFSKDRCLADKTKCVGCGLCAVRCPSEVIQLAARSSGEVEPFRNHLRTGGCAVLMSGASRLTASYNRLSGVNNLCRTCFPYDQPVRFDRGS